MARMTIKRFSSPDETRPFTSNGRAELLEFGGSVVGRGVFEPGWKWSTHVKPIAGTESCEASHMGYVVSGRMHIVMDDGQEEDVGPGDFAVVPPGHDAWTIGNEACVMIDFSGMEDYAKAARGARREAGTGERPHA